MAFGLFVVSVTVHTGPLLDVAVVTQLVAHDQRARLTPRAGAADLFGVKQWWGVPGVSAGHQGGAHRPWTSRAGAAIPRGCHAVGHTDGQRRWVLTFAVSMRTALGDRIIPSYEIDMPSPRGGCRALRSSRFVPARSCLLSRFGRILPAECHPVDLAQPDRARPRGRPSTRLQRRCQAPPTRSRVVALREVVGMARRSSWRPAARRGQVLVSPKGAYSSSRFVSVLRAVNKRSSKSSGVQPPFEPLSWSMRSSRRSRTDRSTVRYSFSPNMAVAFLLSVPP